MRRESDAVKRIFYGLRPASTALIAAAGLGVAKVSLLDTALYEKSGSLIALFQWPAILLAIAIYFALHKYKKHPVLYIAISAVCGIAFGL